MLLSVDCSACSVGSHTLTSRMEGNSLIMQPLTEQVWSQQFADLRPLVQQEFSKLARQDLHTAGGDWDALVALIQRTYNMDADVVRQRLNVVDIDEAENAAGGEQESTDGASVAQLRIEAGFSETEHDGIRELLSKLDRRLNRFPADAVDMELSVKDRDSTSQKVTLEAWLPNLPRVVATSQEISLQDALMDVREDMLRQIHEMLEKRQNY